MNLLNLLLPLSLLSGIESGHYTASEPEFASKADTLTASSVSSSLKGLSARAEAGSMVTTYGRKSIVARGLDSPKNFSILVPGLYIPDYGSSITSTIYMRGFGSRMENSVVGMYVDDIPVLNKNAYDSNLMDVSRVDFLSGPQGTIAGANSMLGVMSVTTLSPASHQGSSFSVEGGNGGIISAKGSVFKGRIGVTASYKHIGGFYTNEFTGKKADVSDEAGVRIRYSVRPKADRFFDNILTVGYTDQAGYPYQRYFASKEDAAAVLPADIVSKSTGYENGTLAPVYYDSYSGYKRLNATDGFRWTLSKDRFTLSSVSAIHFLHDKMDMDNDFTQNPVFKLNQKQTQTAFTQELVFKPHVASAPWWKSQTGFYGMVSYTDLRDPVTFLSGGVKDVILGNANANIPPRVGHLALDDESFVVRDNFYQWAANLALYHESCFEVGKWRFTAGLRLDWQRNSMDYDCGSQIHYQFVSQIPGVGMQTSKPLSINNIGNLHESSMVLLPKVGIVHDFGPVSVFGTVSTGFRAGGFNTNIFSDLVSGQFMGSIMGDMAANDPTGMLAQMFGKLPTGSTSSASDSKYKPEKSFNYEVGAKMEHTFGQVDVMAKVSAFYISFKDQQVTVMSPGAATGRMMANSGKSESYGVEAAGYILWKGLALNATWGWTHAKFIDFSDGKNDYAGNWIPYAPQSTLSARSSYRFSFNGDAVKALEIGAGLSGVGRIRWNEANSLTQKAYQMLNADITLETKWFDIYVRGENLTDKNAGLFYFKSMNNEFFQLSRPRRFIAGIRVEF